MLHCPKCGQGNPAQSNFCSNCGAPLVHAEGSHGDTTRIIPVVSDDTVLVDELSPEDEQIISQLRRGSALLIVRRPALDERFLLNESRTEAGRSPRCDIFLDDITVSRHHAEFLISETDGVSVHDLGSLNGTYVNKKLVEGTVELRTGDEVQIGKFKMVCFVGGAGVR